MDQVKLVKTAFKKFEVTSIRQQPVQDSKNHKKFSVLNTVSISNHLKQKKIEANNSILKK